MWWVCSPPHFAMNENVSWFCLELHRKHFKKQFMPFGPSFRIRLGFDRTLSPARTITPRPQIQLRLVWDHQNPMKTRTRSIEWHLRYLVLMMRTCKHYLDHDCHTLRMCMPYALAQSGTVSRHKPFHSPETTVPVLYSTQGVGQRAGNGLRLFWRPAGVLCIFHGDPRGEYS